MKDNSVLKVEVVVAKPIDVVWKAWTTPTDAKLWNIPFPDWHCPKAEIDLREGGFFSFRMEKIDGSEGFDHSGFYDKVIANQLIEYTGLDKRKSIIEFIENQNITTISEIFEPEEMTPIDLQRDFCQSVLKNFKKHVESKV
jgi:hypothetical protein